MTKSKGSSLGHEINVYTRESAEILLTFFSLFEHRMKIVAREPESKSSPGTVAASPSILGFLGSRVMRNECCYLSLWLERLRHQGVNNSALSALGYVRRNKSSLIFRKVRLEARLSTGVSTSLALS